MVIEINKIFTTSARDYCESHGKELLEYEMRAVHYESKEHEGYRKLIGRIKDFADLVPDTAEVVVDLHFSFGLSHMLGLEGIISGTALISKNRN